MNAEDLRVEILGMLAEIRSAGLGASRSDLGRILDHRLPSLVVSQDAVAGVSMSDAFRLRLGEAVSDACAAARERLEAQVVDGNAMPRRTPSQMRTLGWALAAAAVLLIGMWLYGLIAPRGQIVAPKVTPPVTGPEKPIVPRLERKPSGPTAQIEPGKRQRSVKGPIEIVPKRDSGKVAVNEPPAIGEITRIEGEPNLFEPGELKPRIVREKTALVAGTRIETGDMDRAEIMLKDGSVLRLAFNTAIVHRGTEDVATAREFELLSGSVYAIVAPTPDLANFTIETPVATAQVLATEFGLRLEKVRSTNAEPKVRALLQVKTGRVAFYNEFNRVVATEMTESAAVTGSAPTEPRRINVLRIYSFEGTDQKLERRTFPLDEEGAASYYVFPRGSAGFMAGTMANGELRIVTLSQDASARKAGLRVGDAILALDGQRQTMDGLRRSIYERGGSTVLLKIRREGAEFEAAVPVIIDDRVAPTLPTRIAYPIFKATRPALAGDTDGALRQLTRLAKDLPHPAVYNNLGVVYERLDRMPPAIRSYRAAVRLDDKTALYRRNLARVLLNIGHSDQAVELLEEALATNPEDVDTIFALADAHQITGHPEAALTLLDQATERLPDLVSLWITRAAALMNAQRLDEGIESARRAVQLAPDNASAYFRLGLGLNFRGLFADAETAFAKAIDLDPCLATYYNSRAINFRNLRRTDAAEAEYRKAVKLDPEFVPAHFGLGGLLLDTGKLEEARVFLRRAIELDPSHASAHFNLGISYWRSDQFAEAEPFLRKAAALNPVAADIRGAYAGVLKLQGKFKEALPVWKEANRLAPQDPYLWSHLGWSQMENHLWSDALYSLRKTVELDPKGHHGLWARKTLGFALIQQGKLLEAELTLTEALRLEPQDLEVSSNWALLLAHKGLNLEDALERAKKAATPKADAQMFYTLGIVHFKRGELDEAATALKRAVEEFKSYLAADALVLLGQVYEAKKDIPAAISAYRRAIAIESSNRAAAASLKRLEK